MRDGIVRMHDMPLGDAAFPTLCWRQSHHLISLNLPSTF